MKSGWMVVAAILFALMGVLVKQASGDFSSAELVFYRSAFGLAAIWGVIAWRSGRLFSPLATSHGATHFWRGLSGFSALVLFFYAIGRLPLATAVTLNYTAPLFLAVLSVWWLRERHGRGLVAAVILGFVGIVLLLRPQVQQQAWVPALAGLVSGMLAAVAYVNVKQLGRLGEPEWRVVFYFTLSGYPGRRRLDARRRIPSARGGRLADPGWHRGHRHPRATGADARLSPRAHADGGRAGLQHGGFFGDLRRRAVRRAPAWGGVAGDGAGGRRRRAGGACCEPATSGFAIVDRQS
jgi:uncharacterized membrane protein